MFDLLPALMLLRQSRARHLRGLARYRLENGSLSDRTGFSPLFCFGGRGGGARTCQIETRSAEELRRMSEQEGGARRRLEETHARVLARVEASLRRAEENAAELERVGEFRRGVPHRIRRLRRRFRPCSVCLA